MVEVEAAGEVEQAGMARVVVKAQGVQARVEAVAVEVAAMAVVRAAAEWVERLASQ